MDIGKAFSFIGEDERWMQKIGVGVGVFIVPILNFAVMGYVFQLIRNVRDGEERPLPEWHNLSGYIVDGLRMFAVMFIYLLPVLIIYGVISAIFLAQIFSSEFAETAVNGDPFADQAPMFIALWSISMACIMPYSLLMQFLYPLFAMQIVRTGTIKSCFDYKDMWQILKSNIWNYVIIVGLMFGLYIGSSFVLLPIYVLMLIPCIGFLIAIAIMSALYMLIVTVGGHLMGQFMGLQDAAPSAATS